MSDGGSGSLGGVGRSPTLPTQPRRRRELVNDRISWRSRSALPGVLRKAIGRLASRPLPKGKGSDQAVQMMMAIIRRGLTNIATWAISILRTAIKTAVGSFGDVRG